MLGKCYVSHVSTLPYPQCTQHVFCVRVSLVCPAFLPTAPHGHRCWDLGMHWVHETSIPFEGGGSPNHVATHACHHPNPYHVCSHYYTVPGWCAADQHACLSAGIIHAAPQHSVHNSPFSCVRLAAGLFPGHTACTGLT